VPEGTQVEVGDVLVRFDAAPFAEELETSREQLAQAERELQKAESSFEDLKPLLAEGSITKLELDRAQQAVEKEKEDLELLRATPPPSTIAPRAGCETGPSGSSSSRST
jgi:multidrug resistance efflux pump